MYEPDHATDLELSGKCGLLLDLVRSILDAGEKVLVFSQYVSTLNLLEGLLAKHLFVAPAVLTGEMSVQEKDAAVRKFQARGPAFAAAPVSRRVCGSGGPRSAVGAQHISRPVLLRLFSFPTGFPEQPGVQRVPPLSQSRRSRAQPHRGVPRHPL